MVKNHYLNQVELIVLSKMEIQILLLEINKPFLLHKYLFKYFTTGMVVNING